MSNFGTSALFGAIWAGNRAAERQRSALAAEVSGLRRSVEAEAAARGSRERRDADRATQQTVDRALGKAEAAYDRGDWPKVIKHLDRLEVLETYGLDYHELVMRSRSHGKLGAWSLALADLRSATDSEEEYHEDLAWLLTYCDRLDEAEIECRALLEAGHATTRLHCIRGLAAARRGDLVMLNLSFDRAEALDPVDPTIPFRRSTALEELGRSGHDPAITHAALALVADAAGRAAAIAPVDDPLFVTSWLFALSRLGREADVLPLVAARLPAYSDPVVRADLYMARAMALVMLGRPGDAVADLDRSLDLVPDAVVDPGWQRVREDAGQPGVARLRASMPTTCSCGRPADPRGYAETIAEQSACRSVPAAKKVQTVLNYLLTQERLLTVPSPSGTGWLDDSRVRAARLLVEAGYLTAADDGRVFVRQRTPAPLCRKCYLRETRALYASIDSGY